MFSKVFFPSCHITKILGEIMFLKKWFQYLQLYGDITPQNIFLMALLLIIINKIILFSQNTSKKVQHKRAIQIKTMKKKKQWKKKQ